MGWRSPRNQTDGKGWNPSYLGTYGVGKSVSSRKEKDGTFRICRAFRSSNRYIQSDKYPLPGVEDLLTRLGPGNKYFAKLDLEAAYHQIPLAMDSQPLITGDST